MVKKEFLEQFINKIETLEKEKSEILEYIKEAYQEAKSSGFDVKTLRQIIKLRKIDKDKREQQDAILELYRSILDI